MHLQRLSAQTESDDTAGGIRMPIEIWWWLKPLWLTGFVTLVVFTPISILVDKAKPGNVVGYVLAVIAALPFCSSVVVFVGWFFANLFVLIWRC